MLKNVIGISEIYRRNPKMPFEGHKKGDASNLVPYDRLASYREREYTEKFGAFMKEWVSFSEDRRNEHEHPLSTLREAFDAFVLAATNHSGFLQRRSDVQADKELRRLRRVKMLSGKFEAQTPALSRITTLYCDETDDCFAKIDLILLGMEKEFGLLLPKRQALPAPS